MNFLVTDELVEAVAKALDDYEFPGEGWESEASSDFWRLTCRERARAALEAVAPLISAKALLDAARVMRSCKDPGHWNLRDPHDPETSYSPDAWLEAQARHIERGES